jgi:hypothetical protein
MPKQKNHQPRKPNYVKRRPSIQRKVLHCAHAETKESPTRKTEQCGSGALVSNAKSCVMHTPKPKNCQPRKPNNVEATHEHPMQSLVSCTGQNRSITNQENRTMWKRHPSVQCKVVCHARAETQESLTKKTKQHGSDARAFNLTQPVINPWTTLPLPTTGTWIRQHADAKKRWTTLPLPTTETRYEKENGAKLQILAIDKSAQA